MMPNHLQYILMRYIIGIDLGTTNSCVSYVDTEQTNHAIQPFRIQQLTAAGYVDACPTLPSFCYLASEHEWPPSALDLPWSKRNDFFVGKFAHEQGSKVPTKLVRSAKSWLCHAAANRRDKILPAEATGECTRISPVEATARYLRHIKEAWDHQIAQSDPQSAFTEQEIVLTVPASFDEVARTLTIEAAKLAGYVHLTLLEEPQAAFYSWISYHEAGWEKQLKAGDKIIVCDVGGGTTDFSLIEVIEKEGKLSLQRMSVGDHLLLGGDNMDAALAHIVEQKLNSGELSTTQWLQLCHQAQCAKEHLLAPDTADDEVYKIILQGSGSGVVRGSMTADITKHEVEQCLLEGFFSSHTWEDALNLKKARGLRTMGLPFEDEPSITKHLAQFLKHSTQENIPPSAPSYILFNGGAMKAPAFQKAIVKSLEAWFEKPVKILPSANLDLAVARGAAYYGKVRRGLGVKIGGGTARGYYLAVGTKGIEGINTQALTLLPRGSEEGSFFEPSTIFSLTPNTPVSFQLYTSHTRLHDKSGDLISIDPSEMQALPPIHTILRFGKQHTNPKVPINLKIGLTAIGTLELALKSRETTHQWALEFQLRSAAGQDNSLAVLEKRQSDETLDATQMKEAQNAVHALFSEQSKSIPGSIMEQLETILGTARRDWSISTLRKLCDAILQNAAGRKRSAEYESRWWNLIGFCLRPGFSYPLDDFRIKEIWKIILGDLKISRPLDSQIQCWICYRRIAGGLNRGQQSQLASELIPLVIDKKTGKIELKNKGDIYAYSEKIRVLGALELMDVSLKTKLGKALLERIALHEGSSAEFWTLGRLGARHLLYGAAANVLPRDVCEQWIYALLKLKNTDNENFLFAIEQLARKTDQRDLNLSSQVIEKILERFKGHPEYDRLDSLLMQDGPLTQAEQEHIYGDRLPVGLSIES